MSASYYAVASDLAVRWRPLTDEEQVRAGVLLDDASRFLRRKFPSLDADIESGALDVEDARMVATAMVRQIMEAPPDGVQSETVGPFARSYRDGSNFYLTGQELGMLTPATVSAKTVWLA